MAVALSTWRWLNMADTPRFTDIDSSVHRENIEHVVSEGVMRGFPDGTFRPRSPVTREQLASTIANLMGWVTRR